MKSGGLIVCALLLAAAVVGGVVRLFELRFERGDIYPPYSTLRTDPLGVSALYESLDRVPGLSARRYFERTFKESDGHERTLMILGLEPGALEELPRTEFNTIQQFAYNGGRVVLAYAPETSRIPIHREHDTPIPQKAKDGPKNTGGPAPPPKGPVSKPDESVPDEKKNDEKSATNNPDDDAEDYRRSAVEYASLEAEWGFGLDFQTLTTNDDGLVQFPMARHANAADGLPSELVFHTGLFFEGLTNGWTQIYAHDDRPVMAERRLGKGSVLLVADAYYFSNEAMLTNRQTGVLAWTIGGGRDVIFDEAHLGVTVNPGVASLMRKYHLHGLFFSLLLLAGLFVWKNSASLVPPCEEVSQQVPAVTGKDAMAGFVNLLRRGIPRAAIMSRIFEAWQKTGHRSALNKEHRQEIESLMQQENARPAAQRQPLNAYRTISTILQRRK